MATRFDESISVRANPPVNSGVGRRWPSIDDHCRRASPLSTLTRRGPPGLKARARGWAYAAEEGRDLRIDLLRGLAVLAMVIDHLAGPSRLYLLTGGNRFYTSAAEGFILLSGMTVGLVYRHVAEQHGLATALRRLVARAWTLYVLAIGLTLVMLPVSEVAQLPWAFGIEESTPLQVVWAILSLHQTYYLVDVLTLYVLLMLGAPLALFLLCEGRTWVLLTSSWLIWAGFQIFPQQTDLPWTIAGNNLFYLPAWQALFFTAMAIGYHRQHLAESISPAWQPALLVGTGISFAALVALSINQSAALQALQSSFAPAAGDAPAWSVADLEAALFGKGDVRPGRVLASLAVFGFLFSLTTRCWTPVRHALGWLLLPLGQNALYAYSAHVVLALALGLLTIRVDVTGNSSINAAIQAAGIGLIWVAIRLRVLYPRKEHQRRWMAMVVPLAVAAFVLFRVQPSPALAGVVPRPELGNAADDAVRHARAFGTPIPRQASGSPGRVAVSAASPQPDGSPPPRAPSGTPVSLSVPLASAARAEVTSVHVGPITGSFGEAFFYSPSLDRDMSYYVYLPPGYGSESRRYPVLYMLHGGGGSKDEWPAYGLVNDLDQAIVSKDVAPLILVLPQGDEGYWVNWPAGGPQWGDYVARDLRRQVDSTYRTLPGMAHRAIGGLSMGAAGALQLAFNHPDVFGVVGGHSPSLHVDDNTFSEIYGVGSDFAQREPIALADSAPGIDGLKIWIDAGQDDPWLERDQLLHQHLTDRGIAHNWSVLEGGHDGQYWIQNLPLYLRFYDTALNRSTRP